MLFPCSGYIIGGTRSVQVRKIRKYINFFLWVKSYRMIGIDGLQKWGRKSEEKQMRILNVQLRNRTAREIGIYLTRLVELECPLDMSRQFLREFMRRTVSKFPRSYILSGEIFVGEELPFPIARMSDRGYI